MNSLRSGFLLFCLCAVTAILISPAARAAKSYNFSVNPWGTVDEMKDMFRPFLDYIEEETGVHFEIVILPSYEDVIKELESGYIHFAAVNAVSYLQLRRESARITYLATSVRSFGEFERESYMGYIIAKKNAKFDSFDDLRGKTFAFVEETSGSGYKMPVAMLGLKGEKPATFFKKYFFLGDHDEVAKAVKNGCVDAGATWEASYIINVRRFGDVFKIVEETPPIPNDAWVIRNELPNDLKQQIKTLLLSTTKDTRNAAGDPVLNEKLGLPETGFVEKPPEFYEDAAPLLLYEEKAD